MEAEVCYRNFVSVDPDLSELLVSDYNIYPQRVVSAISIRFKALKLCSTISSINYSSRERASLREIEGITIDELRDIDRDRGV